MPLEKNVIAIKKAHTQTNKVLKEISKWQINHEKEDSKRFQDIADSIAKLPSEQTITDAVAASVKVTVNGKIDAVKLHLDEQDAQMTIISNKIKPIDGARTWLKETAQIIVYLGTFALAITGIVELLHLIGIIK